jgi:glycosyltransferase involved in cell wall biosynthesis
MDTQRAELAQTLRKVLYTAAHGSFPPDVPLGGAAAVCSQLTAEWNKTNPFPFKVLDPSILQSQAPRGKDLVEYSELRYARFCFLFQKALTEEIFRHAPEETVVLSNDISEGPDFLRLSKAGYRIYTLFHVDVLDYFTRMYLRGCVKPQTAAHWYDALARMRCDCLVPKLLKLVFKKQADCVRNSRGIIVPSQEMEDIIMRCYPDTPQSRVHVLPWGLTDASLDEAAVQQRKEVLAQEYSIKPEQPVLVLLSRISPEKGQDRLLEAVRLWEKEPDFPAEGITVIVAGEAAYMHGKRWMSKLKNLSQRLKRTRVFFPGHLTAIDKEAHLRLGWLYVFPSRHESYGLTLLEAMRAGLPALVCRHYGSEETMRPEFGETVSSLKEKQIPVLIKDALKRLLSDRQKLRLMGEKAKTFAGQKRFADTAKRLAEIIKTSFPSA